MSTTFGKRLAMARAKKNLTQRQLGEMANVTWSQISKYEAGKAKPRLAVLLSLAAILEVEADYLSGDSSDEQGREITLMLTASETEAIEELAAKEGISFDQAVNQMIAAGMKDRIEKSPDLMAQLEAEIPGGYAKLLELLGKKTD